MSVIHLKKKDVVKSKVRGVEIEFDHEKLATILEKEDERNKDDFDWEAVIDEAAVEGESVSGEKFYDAEDETQGSPEVQEEIPAAAPQSSTRAKDKAFRSRPSGPIGEFRKMSY
ncbi:hypothetical protein Dimus_031962 [Dionaea muscipula]